MVEDTEFKLSCQAYNIFLTFPSLKIGRCIYFQNSSALPILC